MGWAIDPDIEAFVDSTIDSFVTWDVIVFFHDWPGFAGDASAIAQHLGRSESEISRSAAHLVSIGVVRATPTGSAELYALNPDEEISARIERFCAALEKRDTRLALLSLLLRKGIR